MFPALAAPVRLDAAAFLTEVDALRRASSPRRTEAPRAELAQIMTPAAIAELMASMLAVNRPEVRLLDAGAGTGSLTAATVCAMVGARRRPKAIVLTAYEIDPGLSPFLNETLDLCAAYCRDVGTAFSAEVILGDFLEAASRAPEPRFDYAVLNPPYRKLRADSKERRLVRELGVDVSNLYAGFVAAAIRLLEPGGQLVSITPRSFANGPYFRAFRHFLLSEVAIRGVHVFDSRHEPFKDDDVLQETVIIHGERGRIAKSVVLSASATPTAPVRFRTVPIEAVVHRSDPDKCIHLVVDEDGDEIARRVARLEQGLEDLDLAVSTGPVVDFRVREHLRREIGAHAVPLVYPSNLVSGSVRWPLAPPKKPTALAINDATSKLAFPDGNYVLIRRFSAKEERRRIVAAVYEAGQAPTRAVAFENHLNVFHRNRRGLPAALARGLALYLNSSLVDDHFRQFSGHTQVNASDLRRLRYPGTDRLEHAGALIGATWPTQAEIDEVTDRILAPRD